MKRFLVRGALIGVGIAVALLLLVVGFRGGDSLDDVREESPNISLSQPKAWPAIRSDAVGSPAEFALVTLWQDGRVFYRLAVNGYPASVATIRREGLSNYTAYFSLGLRNADGLQIAEERIPLWEMDLVRGSSPQPSGLTWQGNAPLFADRYREATTWTLDWVGVADGSRETPVGLPWLPPQGLPVDDSRTP